MKDEKKISATSGADATKAIKRERADGRGVYNPFYFIWLALQSMWRNRIMTVASVLVLTSCLTLLGCFGLLFKNLNFIFGFMKNLLPYFSHISNGFSQSILNKL